MTLLNTADAIYVGGSAASAVYAGDTLVWSAVPPFVPSDIAGLEVWLDASQLALADGAPITAWPNLGDGAEPAIVAGATPITFKAALLNDLPVARFVYQGSRVRGAWPLSIYDWTVIYITQFRGPNVGRGFSIQYPPSNLLVGFHTSQKDVMYDNGEWVGGVPWGPPYPWQIFEADSASGLGIRFYINGVLKGSSGGVGGFANGWGLSGYEASGNAETMDIDVAELVLYRRRLDDAERIAVEEYLRAKWGLS